MITADSIAKALKGKKQKKGWSARCPAHDDQHASLSISNGRNGHPVVRCHAGCSQQQVIDELERRGLWNGAAANGASRIATVETYDYRDEKRVLLFQVLRQADKSFPQRRPDGNGGWIWKLGDVRRVLYRLPELLEALAADRTVPVYVVEGEKDVENLRKLGITATCNPGGADATGGQCKWRREFNEVFAGADVVVIPDNDPQKTKPDGSLCFHPDGRPVFPGQDHAQEVARNLHGIAARVRVLELYKHWPQCPPKGDVSDWLKDGGTVERLEGYANATPEWTPGEGQEQPNANTPKIQTSAQFVRDLAPPDYVIDGILQRGFFYSFTGCTGSGKTAMLLLISAHVALGRPIGNCGVQEGRVLYFAGENPDDMRMRWIALSQHLHFDVDTIPVHFIPGVFKISEMLKRIVAEAEKIGKFAFVVVDTSAVYFEGSDENDNVQAGTHATRLRSLVTLPGRPCVVAACHPPKNAHDNLIPRGGGAFIAAVDGNLTSKLIDGSTEMHCQGKFRGPDFPPMAFSLRTVTHECLKDSKGRLMPTVIASYLTEDGQEELTKVAQGNEMLLLEAVAKYPNASLAERARQLQWFMPRTAQPYRSRVVNVLAKLKEDKLVVNEGGLELTEKGKKVLAKWRNNTG